ncbi:hypothetical protein CABS01_06378 [Colletotrichum abscissum]|uniref:NmrA-like domain-containing protein n=2 Tax=Colletotrichum acutatum species complex TaxID=2707335 RepID=A0A9P9XFL0_9PEZI|nr:uncharacterized protein CCOS01_00234 [Colletotrichum costaricense]XP_060404281.1 uncharacterized protein CABS01_06378 [Colletotrichum abscissum]KAI3552864.1 hypothetical protein CABS02_06869 [Colletotrichum abscissum]KAK1516411.1 hypothetical protein CABS01_06378 [Colletotrichum abscissum]KAK1538920.1 hypothetical protein CCOS01_00234 [Colletotrichum costaricense]
MTRLLTVFGATGQQGGALVNHVLNTPALSSFFQLRAVSRDASKPAAVALRRQGVDLVEANLDDPASLKKAVAGAQVVFAVTNYWEEPGVEREIRQGKAIADACVAAGVDQIIWSSLPSISKISGGRIDVVRHFESKAVVEEYIRGLEIMSTFYMAGWFMQNYAQVPALLPVSDGTYYIFSQPWSPSTQLPLIDIRDTGKFLAPALLDPAVFHGKNLACATAYYSMNEMAAAWTRVKGTEVVYKQLGADEPLPGFPEELAHNFKEGLAFVEEVGYFGPAGPTDVVWTLEQLHGVPGSHSLGTWEDFLRENSL